MFSPILWNYLFCVSLNVSYVRFEGFCFDCGGKECTIDEFDWKRWFPSHPLEFIEIDPPTFDPPSGKFMEFIEYVTGWGSAKDALLLPLLYNAPCWGHYKKSWKQNVSLIKKLCEQIS